MPLQIDRVDTEIEIMRKETTDVGDVADSNTGSGGAETLATVRGRAVLREKLRPIVMEILNDELMRIKRKVGSP